MEQANESSSGTITLKKDMLWKATTFIFAALLVVSLFTGGFGLKKSDTTVTGNVVNNPTNPSIDNPTPSAVKVSVDDDAVEGKANAPITIVEFSDYQCPFCRKFWTETLPSIRKDYVDTGKVKIVYRDFPLSSLHPMAQKTAEATECVRDAAGGKGDAAYFKFHDKIFEEQNILDSGTKNGAVTKTATYTNDDLKKWAKDLDYDIGSCLDSGKYASEVQKDEQDGQSYGVQGTPAFFVNGQLLSGAQPYSAFKQVIDAQLAK
ncbi:disulfide bond formation protein DsbA [Candidatus Pacearchaeota archaeon CG10_big_fil_rev_8_21_14_0_10_32_14]|nr:MAG: disulfide bond formation protein DsbA [Candidatus Pacearchaeota archaeon CG10_big_fil_rev_8_21_14_0_10_32_14]